ncbi:MAG: amino acid ABC transporter substrate-binding protein [Bordetella sp.]|nr:MAG: amino acid ABC transporter substrate-binding protein [Bordetella sp.]
MKFLKKFSFIVITYLILENCLSANTLNLVRQRNMILCGATTGFFGFSSLDSKGIWQGLDIDFCRALSAAVFGDSNKVKIVPLNSQQRFTALQSGEVDVLAHNTSITLQRDSVLGITHVGINFYDGRGFMVPKSLGIKSAKDLNEATICLQSGTSNESTLNDWARTNNVNYKPIVIENFNEVVNAFISGRCDAFSTDISGLASIHASKLNKPEQYIILPEIISKEPLGPFVRQGDESWLNIARWVLFSMIEAEEFGINSKNVDFQLDNKNPNIRRLLGILPGLGNSIGLDDKWAYNIIKQVGNYGESFERNIGQASSLKIPRGLNAQWKDGGLMYAIPVR